MMCRLFARRSTSFFAIMGVLLLGTQGCLKDKNLRLQAEDESEHPKKYEVKTIGDVTGVGGARPTVVSGVGLVVGLEGTGGGAPPGTYRAMMENELQKRKDAAEHVKEILGSKNNALVLVSAVIPPGARKGDALDVEVTLPAGSTVTSLRGGYLKECVLKNYDTAANLLNSPDKGNRPLEGHPLAKAEGTVQVGAGDEASGSLKRGMVWGGGRCQVDSFFTLPLNEKDQFARITQAVADRINETFHGVYSGGVSGQVATTVGKYNIALRVPQQYQHNLPRFLRVVRLIPLYEPDMEKEMRQDRLLAGSALPANTRLSYRRRLETELLDPARTIYAALRLEAMGQESIPALKHGLDSDHALVRFASAEALAYLGSPACGEELARLTEQQPMLRAFCLTAMASLDESVCRIKLRELLASTSPETRYGAFRALRALDEHDEAVQGVQLNESYWLHRAVPNTTPLVHVSSSRRAEVVLFGTEPMLVPAFSFLAGEFTVTAGGDDDHCTITRTSLQRGTERKQCSLKLDDVLHVLAGMGGMYPEAVELLKQAHYCKCLNCPVAVDALPQATSVFDLAKEGKRDGKSAQAEEEILKARGDFNATPTLFETSKTNVKTLPTVRDDETTLTDGKSKDEKKIAESKTPWWKWK